MIYIGRVYPENFVLSFVGPSKTWLKYFSFKTQPLQLFKNKFENFDDCEKLKFEKLNYEIDSFQKQFITVNPEGFSFRRQPFKSVELLIKWFKVHYRDPILPKV
jgi:hypothetical protein